MCKNTKSDFFILLEKHSFIPLTEYKNTTTKMKFKNIKCGHEFEYRPDSFKRRFKNNNFACPKCSGVNSKFTFEDIKKKVLDATQKEFKVVSKKKDYESTRSKIEIFHKTCGKVTEITYKNFSLGKRCRHCAAKSTNSKASQLLKRLLEQVNIDFIEEKRFEDCINPITGYKLPFDFYIPKFNLLIEIDGEQHFIPVERFGGEESLKSNKYRDYIKDKFCLDEKIKLIRVPLVNPDTLKKYSFDEIKVIIFNLLYDLSFDKFKET